MDNKFRKRADKEWNHQQVDIELSLDDVAPGYTPTPFW